MATERATANPSHANILLSHSSPTRAQTAAMRAVSEDAPVSEPGPSTAPGGDELLASGPKKDRKRSSIAILKRAHTVNLDDLKPDHDGDGKVSAFEKEVWKRLQAVDKDGDGKVSVDELYAIVAEATRKKTKLRLYRRMFIGASLFAVLLVVAISAMTALILAAFKDTRAAQASVLADDEGRVMQTVEASTPLPLVAAPVLRKDQLLSIKTLSVKTADPEQPDREMKASFAIASVHWYNLTAVRFETETHDEIRVWNGEATLVTADGTVLPLCEADVTCSAFTVDDVEVAETVVEQAKEALIGAGFEDVAASIARRRLQVPRAAAPPCPPPSPAALPPPHPRSVLVRCPSATRSTSSSGRRARRRRRRASRRTSPMTRRSTRRRRRTRRRRSTRRRRRRRRRRW